MCSTAEACALRGKSSDWLVLATDPDTQSHFACQLTLPRDLGQPQGQIKLTPSIPRTSCPFTATCSPPGYASSLEMVI